MFKFNRNTEIQKTFIRFDVGDIVRQYKVCIKPDETAEDLTNRLAEVGARQLMECFRDLPRSLEYAIPQPEDGVTKGIFFHCTYETRNYT